MNFGEIKKSVAEMLNMLSSDNTTILSGKVTETTLGRTANRIYREEIFQVIADKFPDDFIQDAVPFNTYTATGVVQATSSGTTLVVIDTNGDGIFNNYMLGIAIYNPSGSVVTAKILTYTDSSTVTLDTSVATDWMGDTVYVLGNEFILDGDLTDAKETAMVRIKYSSTDTNYRTAERINYRDAFSTGNEIYYKTSPKWYLTSTMVSEVMVPTVGILPAPDVYNGLIQLRYTQQPKELESETEEPKLVVQGLSNVLIYGTCAWGFLVMDDTAKADRMQQLYEKSKAELINNYKPKNRSGGKKVSFPTYHDWMRGHHG